MDRNCPISPGLSLDAAFEVPLLQIALKILLHISTHAEAGVTHHQDHLHNTDRVAVIHLLASDPDRHGTGIGRCLLEKARDVARERNADVIRLDTLPYNTPARHLYESFGFQYRGNIEIYYPSAGTIPFSMYEYLL